VDELLLKPDTEVPVGTVMAKIHAEAAQEAAQEAAEEVPEEVTEEAAGEFTQEAAEEVTEEVAEEVADKAAEAEISTQKAAKQKQPIKPTKSPAKTTAAPTPATADGKRLRVSPIARKVAAELGVDLAQVKGTGAEGAIQERDVREAAQTAKLEKPAIALPVETPAVEVPTSPAKPPASIEFQAGMRRAIAAAMSRANRDIPHYYLETQIDMSHPLKWLEAENQKRSIKDRILPVILLIKATAKALAEVPELNGYWIGDRLQVEESIHIGFAISLRQGGLVTPAIHHADLKSLDELMAAMRDLIERTRGGRLRSSELTDATITLTSLGDIGVEKVFGVIYPPQVALVGFGKITEKPWAEKGMLAVRSVITATLAGDHRATDGIIGARFLQALNAQLQAPEQL
ncbi:MAG TPA: dihydrolipoamide acetyltransferase family protein, partial [Chroococcidiopsis sp.]